MGEVIKILLEDIMYTVQFSHLTRCLTWSWLYFKGADLEYLILSEIHICMYSIYLEFHVFIMPSTPFFIPLAMFSIFSLKLPFCLKF